MPNVQNGTGSVLAQDLAGTAAAYVYGPIEGGNKQVLIKGLVFSNESASATTVTYGVGKAGKTLGAAGTSAAKTAAIAAAGSASSTLDAEELEDMVLGVGDYVWCSAGTGGVVGVTLNGIAY